MHYVKFKRRYMDDRVTRWEWLTAAMMGGSGPNRWGFSNRFAACAWISRDRGRFREDEMVRDYKIITTGEQ